MAERQAPQPWEQREGETSKAYSAFLVYRDLGLTRTFDRAGLEIAPPASGAHGGRKRGATGRIREWAKRWEWAERAQAWDLHQAALKQKGADQVAIRSGREWAERRDQTLREVYEIGKKSLKQVVDVMAAFPVVRQTRQRPDGSITVFEPLEPDAARQAVVMLDKLHGVLMDVCDRGLGIENDVAIQKANAEAAARPEGDVSDAAKLLEEWRAGQRKSMLTVDMLKPPGQPVAPESEPEPARRNGSGVPPVPASST